MIRVFPAIFLAFASLSSVAMADFVIPNAIFETINLKNESGSVGAALNLAAPGFSETLSVPSGSIRFHAAASDLTSGSSEVAVPYSNSAGFGVGIGTGPTYFAGVQNALDANFNETLELSLGSHFLEGFQFASIDFTDFDSGESFRLSKATGGSQTITFGDLVGSTYTFSSAFLLGKDEHFTMTALSGSIGVSGMVVAVPEPSSFAMAAIGGLGVMIGVRRRRKLATAK
ncbi:hypothetical protein Poly51_27140 [Rubripirellula tenax]|uniref:Ice-binding protein C-terminal domain-containing protein n=2 Tax=Rubripirellula tenax TaxID=2528015 RepID=A0A5C6F8T4_9BACT|nr:hypothetical protein Poly51_27140 [Rubripirellula tenax]